MTTYTPTTVEPGKISQRAGEAAREGERAIAARRRPRRGALLFASGFILGAFATTISSLFGRRRRMPFVLGNRNVFVSLPFSGINMSAPSIRARGRGRRQRGFGRWSRGMARSMTRGAASGVVRGVARGRERAKRS